MAVRLVDRVDGGWLDDMSIDVLGGGGMRLGDGLDGFDIILI